LGARAGDVPGPHRGGGCQLHGRHGITLLSSCRTRKARNPPLCPRLDKRRPAGHSRAVRTGVTGQSGTLWRHRNFLLLWSGQSVSEIGSSVTLLALPLTAVVVLRASTFQVGLLTAASTAAFALIALPAGALVDRWAKRRLMIWCDAARMLIIGSVPVAAALHLLTMGQLYAVAVTAGVCTVFFDVAYQSYLPVVVAREQLVDGNGKLGATQSFAQVAGPGLGGGLVGLVGAARALGADAISYAISVASLLAMRGVRGETSPRPRGVPGGRPPGSTLRAEIAEGRSFVLRHPILRKIAAST